MTGRNTDSSEIEKDGEKSLTTADRIEELEDRVFELEEKIESLTEKNEEKYYRPELSY